MKELHLIVFDQMPFPTKSYHPSYILQPKTFTCPAFPSN